MGQPQMRGWPSHPSTFTEEKEWSPPPLPAQLPTGWWGGEWSTHPPTDSPADFCRLDSGRRQRFISRRHVYPHAQHRPNLQKQGSKKGRGFITHPLSTPPLQFTSHAQHPAYIEGCTRLGVPSLYRMAPIRNPLLPHRHSTPPTHRHSTPSNPRPPALSRSPTWACRPVPHPATPSPRWQSRGQ